MMVSYDDIELAITELESDLSHFEKQFATEQSLFLDVLQTQIFPVLDEKHRPLLLFICTTLYFAKSKKSNDISEFDLEAFIEAEETNWEIKEKSNDWSDCLNKYFTSYPEEDMLAFVEDISATGDEHQINDTDVEIIFICCKSYIDQMIAN